MSNNLAVVLLLGFFGGIVGELLAVSTEVKHRKRLVSSRRGKTLLLTLPIDGCAALLVTWAYSSAPGSISPILALQIGASTPLILQRMAIAAGPLRPLDEGHPNFAVMRSKIPLVETVRRHLALDESD